MKTRASFNTSVDARETGILIRTRCRIQISNTQKNANSRKQSVNTISFCTGSGPVVLREAEDLLQHGRVRIGIGDNDAGKHVGAPQRMGKRLATAEVFNAVAEVTHALVCLVERLVGIDTVVLCGIVEKTHGYHGHGDLFMEEMSISQRR